MSYEILTGVLSLVGALIGAVFGGILSPLINYKFNIKYKERELKLNWKREEFKEIVQKINKKIDNWKAISHDIHSKKYDEKKIKRIIEDEIFKDKIKFGDGFLSFSKEMLESSVKFMSEEALLGITIKEGLKNKKFDDLEIMKLVTNLTLLRINIISLMKRDLKL